jgi:hypothetical protein
MWTSDTFVNGARRYAPGDPATQVGSYGLPGMDDGGGVAFDGSTFWLSDKNTLAQVDFSTETVLRQWDLPLANQMGLAWDSVTDTVWMLNSRDTGGSVPFTALRVCSRSPCFYRLRGYDWIGASDSYIRRTPL